MSKKAMFVEVVETKTYKLLVDNVLFHMATLDPNKKTVDLFLTLADGHTINICLTDDGASVLSDLLRAATD